MKLNKLIAAVTAVLLPLSMVSCGTKENRRFCLTLKESLRDLSPSSILTERPFP